MFHRATLTGVLLTFLTSYASAAGLKDCRLDTESKSDSLIEHLYGGPLSSDDLLVRRAYVQAYNDEMLVPKWASWRAIKAYRDTPTRKGRWSSFRRDPQQPEVVDKDYVGWFDSPDNFARGHIVPYAISGGDRDGDGMDAEYEDSLKVEDLDDACTVFEINALTNIAPQYHGRFNGSKGVWWRLESDVRALLDGGKELHIFAGSVFLEDKPVQKIGRRQGESFARKIGVPHGFFKVVVDLNREEAVAFLFDHQADLSAGCDIDEVSWPSQCVVPIEAIETATGLKFFNHHRSRLNSRLRKSSTANTWLTWLENAS